MNNGEGDEGHSMQRATAAAENACEKWRIRGNQAYEKGYSSKAEEYYTKGINSFIRKGSPECSIEPLVLCYSNRAAARMLCGKMREALSDCLMAESLDPSFQKVQLRAANCHLALGEIEEACQYFSKCLESKGDICLDRRIAIEAASGLQKAQKLSSVMNYCAELLAQKTSTAANDALESIYAVFPTSSYSEKLRELKGEALLMLRRYKDVIQLCEETLVSAEKNFSAVVNDNNPVKVDSSSSKNSTVMLWRWRLMSKSYFYLGKLELALDLLEKQEVLASSDDWSKTKELSFPFAATVRELLHHRSAGNRAFQAGKYTEAVEHYSAAVSSSIESRPFAAICFCNRAAAQQALGQLSDAISDCSIAIALDESYTKAISRRATLHEKIRDYASATSDLERLISLLKEQSQNKNCGAGDDSSSGNNVEELRQARRRLLSLEEKAKKGLPLDHYLILGVKSMEEASEMKKAYRRAALRHHPDKAAQFLARGDNGDDGQQWKEICEEIRKDADRLFKTIGEAYAVLSDPNKRSEYDLQEELRNARKESNRNRDSTDSYSTPFRNSSNRYWQEPWKTYGYSRSRW